MRITFFLPAYFNFPIGGYRVHFSYADLLSRRGHDVTVAFPRFLRWNGSLKTSVRSVLWASSLRFKNRPLIPELAGGSRVKITLLPGLNGKVLPSADVLIATAWQTAEALADAPARCGKKFYIVYDYEHLMTADDAVRAQIENTYRMPFSIVSTSSIVDETIMLCGGRPIAKVYCGIDFNSFGVDVDPEARQPLTVAFAARPEHHKGADDAIAALSALRGVFGRRIEVHAFGARKIDLPDWIQWHQRPSQVELRRLYNSTAVFIVSSHFEGWGLPGAEAMACGAALVTTDNGGCRDYAISGITALVVPPKEPQLLAAAVRSLLENDDHRIRLARAGREFVQRFEWSKATDQIEAAISSS